MWFTHLFAVRMGSSTSWGHAENSYGEWVEVQWSLGKSVWILRYHLGWVFIHKLYLPILSMSLNFWLGSFVQFATLHEQQPGLSEWRSTYRNIAAMILYSFGRGSTALRHTSKLRGNYSADKESKYRQLSRNENTQYGPLPGRDGFDIEEVTITSKPIQCKADPSRWGIESTVAQTRTRSNHLSRSSQWQ